jgi:hypothetical protein
MQTYLEALNSHFHPSRYLKIFKNSGSGAAVEVYTRPNATALTSNRVNTSSPKYFIYGVQLGLTPSCHRHDEYVYVWSVQVYRYTSFLLNIFIVLR